jgi:hypothetical protein
VEYNVEEDRKHKGIKVGVGFIVRRQCQGDGKVSWQGEEQ